MKQLIVVAVIILGGALAAYYYWQQTQPEPEAVKVPALPPPIAPPKPEVRQVVKVPEDRAEKGSGVFSDSQDTTPLTRACRATNGTATAS
ncbi:MAG: hypothetical protein L0H94_12770 [Nitrospira sp.]|nr:hypothetical protein [Nitrospira sp.]